MSTAQDRGRAFDKEIAKRLAYKAQPGSGNKTYAKSDAKDNTTRGRFLIETKYTEQESYKFTAKMWIDHERYAMTYGLIPVMILKFNNPKSRKGIVAILSEEDYMKIGGMTPSEPLVAKGESSYSLDPSIWIPKSKETFETPSFDFIGINFAVTSLDEFEGLKDDYERV